MMSAYLIAFAGQYYVDEWMRLSTKVREITKTQENPFDVVG
jgi:hypothetical protein